MPKFDEMLAKLDSTVDDTYIASLVRYVSQNGLEIEETATLARRIAEAGSSIPAGRGVAADVPSTGGPSSLSTLICPLFLRSKGFTVPKLGVPGRPAGGIDVLATIPNYETKLSRAEVVRCLEECRYAHFLAGGDFVPLDARMFRIRQELGMQDSPHLVAVSLISKKLAASVTRFRLDVRVGPHGNFGRTFEDARTNSMMFNSVAHMIGLDSGCYLSDATAVYQPYIGRGEALVALDDLFNERASPWLREHVGSCWEMTQSLESVADLPDGDLLRRKFSDNLSAQGSGLAEFESRVDEVRSSNKTVVRASSSGHLQVDVDLLRQLIVQVQVGYRTEHAPFPDPCGVELLCRPGQEVDVGQPLALLRGFDALGRVSSRSEATIDSAIFVVPMSTSQSGSAVEPGSEWIMGGVE